MQVSTFHDHARTAFVQQSFAQAAPRVWNSLPHTIADDLNISAQFLNPDLKHSSTEGPISISNHSVTLTVPAIRRIAAFLNLFAYFTTVNISVRYVVN